MKRIQNYIFLFCLLSGGVFWAQNQPNITISTALPNLATDTYTRATSSIKLQPGFKYGHVSGGATNLLNLSLGSNPTYVNSNYLGSAINPANNGCSNGITVDMTRPVGETMGSFLVSSTGAAVYNIPIIVSPGTKGVQPNLAIVHNSQSELGLLGNSWTLTGLSMISRVNKTKQHDGSFDGIQLNSLDVFALDGNRLFALSGSYGQNGTTYYPEVENYTTITSHGVSGNGPQYFLVKDTKGNILEYGNSADSRLTGIGHNTALIWYLNKVTDEYGNYITYNYKILNGELVVDFINYTGNTNAGLQPYNRVEFSYIDLAEKSNYFVAGVEFKRTQLLKQITCFASSNLLKKYIFDYSWDNGTYLNQVKEIDAEGNELNPTLFCWGDPNSYSNLSAQQNMQLFSNAGDYNNMDPIPADVDGDGFTDYVCVTPPNFDGRIRVMKNNFKNNYGVSNASINFSQLSDNFSTYPGASKLLGANVLDENQDNKQEVYTIMSGVSTNGIALTANAYRIIKTEVNPNTNITTVGTFNTPSPFDIQFPVDRFIYDRRDYDGDGTTDELRIDPFSINLTNNLGSVSYAITSPSTVVRPIAFNNDAKLDLLVLDHSNSNSIVVKVLSLNQSAVPQNFTLLYTSTINFPTNSSNSQPFNLLRTFGTGDVNGDRINDLIYMNETFTKLYVHKGTGLGFSVAEEVTSFSPLTLSFGKAFDMRVMDMNGDGKSDLTITDNISQTQNNPLNNYFSYYSIGDKLIKGGSYSGNWKYVRVSVSPPSHYQYNGIDFSINPDKYKQLVDAVIGYQIKADFNGDGIYDMVSYDPSLNTAWIVSNTVNAKTKRSILSILTPLKTRIDLTYANINMGIFVASANKEEIYRKQSSTTFNAPLFNYKPNLYCVNSVKELSGFNYQIVSEKKYTYSDAVFHNQGRGFLGFEKTLVFDRYTKVGIQTSNQFNTTFYSPYTVESFDSKVTTITNTDNIKQFDPDLLQPIAKSNQSISFVPRNAKGFFIRLDQTIKTDYLNSNRVTTQLTYNLQTDGSIASTSSQYGWSGQPVIKTTGSSYQYVLNNGYYKIQKQTTTQTQVGEAAYTRETDFTYDAQGHLTSQTNDPTFGNQSLVTTYTQFDAFGNALKTAVSAGDLVTRNGEVQYDPTGRFVIKTINALGNVSEMTYDNRFGNLLSEKDINGLETKYYYDGLGRNIKTIAPNQAVSTTIYAWDDPGSTYPYHALAGVNTGVYSIRTDVEGQGYTKTYYTTGGLPLRTERPNFDGSATIVNDTKYQFGSSGQYPSGSVLETSEPHLLNQAKYLLQRYDYELSYYRPNTQTTYSVNNGLVANTGIYSTVSYNVPSNNSAYTIASVTKSNQKNQQVVSTTNAAGQTVSVKNTYPGITQTANYTYVSNGGVKTVNLTNSANAGQTISHSFSYNSLGQKIQVNDPSMGIVSYTYNSIGELLAQTDAMGTFSHTYDVLGRLTSKTGSSSGQLLYFYNTSGTSNELLNKITGPNSITEFAYDALNRLTEQKETIDGKIFKTNYTLDKYGHEIKHIYPNNLSINKTFNAFGYLTQITDQNNNLLWQLTNRDASGQLTEYSYGNGIATKQTFDPLHFLTEINHGNGSIHKQNYQYDPLTGNMKERAFTNYLTNTGLKETFSFDVVDRLKQSKQLDVNNNPIQTNNITFDVLGNITHKDDAGDFKYTNPSKPFTLTQIESASTNLSFNTVNATYTDFRKVHQITEMGTNKQFDFVYGTDFERLKMVYKIGGVTQYTRYYAEDYDLQESSSGNTSWTYVFAPSGLCAVYHTNTTGTQCYYALNDHLGSPVLLTNSAQQIVEEYSFDSWGRRRHPNNWSYTSIPAATKMIRGFTLHEQLDELGLINMNGRVYDPVLGRFIQPDKFIQAPDNIQNFNRYSYVLNNPLQYTDPSGYLFSGLKGAFGNFFSGMFHAQNMGGSYNFDPNGNAQIAAEATFEYAKLTAKVQVMIVSSAFGGGVTSFLGSTLPIAYGGLIAVSVGGASAGAFSGALNTYIDGGDVGEAAWKGAVSGLAGGLVGGYVTGGAGAFLGGAVSGGVGSALNGGDINEIGMSALIGGGISFGSYQIQSEINYKVYKRSGGTLTRTQFNIVSRSSQKSFTRGKEYGGWLTADGGVEMFPHGKQAEIKPQAKPSGATGFFHTHPNTGGTWVEIHSPADIRFNDNYALVPSLVIGRQSVYIQQPGQTPSRFSSNYIFNPYPFNYYWFR
ncbi:MAG: RHS repeat-associated core domain-containing protein [Sediminibacterium sp.]|nr:RHS repeat-associated core domain-containing protein [Sediminibacterium sp.]